MDDRESSVASSSDFYESEAKAKPQMSASLAPADPPVAKRKAQSFLSVSEKKRKLDSPTPPAPSTELRSCARLPPQAWQRVFLFCSLADLGRLIQVNRSFHSYLTDVRAVSTQSPQSGCLRLLKSESLWASARNAFPSKPPKPLPGFSELRMLQLAWSKRCQFCQKPNAFAPGDAFWEQGPGSTGVRAIWPFGIKACGPCLMQQCKTDINLLFSPISALRPSLAFALVTNDQHYVPAYVARKTLPVNVEIGKYYYKQYVDQVTQELDEALRLGPAAAEEWCKGLEAREKERMKMAENWEQWESRYRRWTDANGKCATSATSSSIAAPRKEPSTSPKHQARSPILHAPVPASKYSFTALTATRSRGHVQRFTNTPPAPNLTAAAANSHYVHQRPPTVPPQAYTPQPAPTGSAQPNQQRNLHDANEAKATRRADIERRCQQMDPPIPPTILRHMDSFKAAIQISQPMTDYAWNMLQPRLIAQLPAAQQAEADHVSRAASHPSKAADRRHPDVTSKEAKEAMDREWEESQQPIRDRLSAIADEYIKHDWGNGVAISHENSPKFAADLLKHVRRIFYTEGASIQDPQARTKLVLENMKWVYDNKVKPLTEQFRKELFMCNRNDCENNARLYGFEGVVQHFGAKHTNSFSVGNVVVAWREAEWPEETPFHPDPLSVKHAHHAPPSNTAGYGGYHGGFSRAGTSTPHMPAHMPQASPGPYQYPGHYNGPFAPPQASPAGMPGFNYSQPYPPTADGQPHQHMGPPGYGVHPGNHSYMPSPAMASAAVAPVPIAHQPGQTMSETGPNGVDNTSHSTSSFDKEVSTVIRIAPAIWKQTTGIKDMPNSLRVYVLLHRVVSQFLLEFNHEPNLSHFIDALSNHDIPKALKNAPGLSCKACQAEASQHLTGAYYSRPEERTYTVLSLFTHFRAHHLTPHPGPNFGHVATPPDWKEDMITLPNDRVISGLIHAPGMDDEKLLLIATIFPSLFPMPLPKIRKIDSNGMASPVSGPKDASRTSGTPTASRDISESAALASPRPESLPLAKAAEDEYDPRQPSLPGRPGQAPSQENRKRSYRNSPPHDRRERHYTDPRYYVRDQPDDGYRPYMEYAPSPRMVHAGPAYDEYSGRRTAFREPERMYVPPQESYVYAHPREGDYDREFGVPSRQMRYYEDGQHPGYRYVREHRSREESPPRGQAAADRFLDEFVPGVASTEEPIQPPPPPRPSSKPPAPAQDAENGSRFSPPAANQPSADETEARNQSLAALRPNAPSTVSNGSRYEEPHSNGHQALPPDPGPPRRPAPYRRRDRHHDRMPSRYYRYMSVAREREDPYRAPSISRSQSRRYEEQRRRIDQQETPQPSTDARYDPGPRSRDHSVDHPDDLYAPGPHALPRDYVSVQDRPYQFSPPRYRFDEPRPAPVYVDEYGYEVVRVRGDTRPPRGPYMTAPTRYEAEYPYVPVYNERPQSQRYGPGEYMYYEEREREREQPPPRRPAFEAEAEFEAPQAGIKVEGVTPAPGLAPEM